MQKDNKDNKDNKRKATNKRLTRLVRSLSFRSLDKKSKQKSATKGRTHSLVNLPPIQQHEKKPLNLTNSAPVPTRFKQVTFVTNFRPNKDPLYELKKPLNRLLIIYNNNSELIKSGFPEIPEIAKIIQALITNFIKLCVYIQANAKEKNKYISIEPILLQLIDMVENFIRNKITPNFQFDPDKSKTLRLVIGDKQQQFKKLLTAFIVKCKDYHLYQLGKGKIDAELLKSNYNNILTIQINFSALLPEEQRWLTLLTMAENTHGSDEAEDSSDSSFSKNAN